MNREQKRKLIKQAAKVAVAYTRREHEKRLNKSDAFIAARALRLEQTEQAYKEAGKDFTPTKN